MNRIVAALLATFAVTAIPPSTEAGAASPAPQVRVIVTLDEQAPLSPALRGGEGGAPALERRLRTFAATSQTSIRSFLATERAAGRVSSVRSFWIFNGLAVTATESVVSELTARADVAGVRPDGELLAPTVEPASAPVEPNIDLVTAPALWALGARGQGTVVASLDTGVDGTHPDLAAQWRGGSNSWFDPNGEHPDAPFDPSGHGTATMSVMVGRDLGGTAIGVAPEAQWISAKIFDDSGVARVSAIHAAFQWALDPDGDPVTADAPDVVNASWTFSSPGCDLEFEPDLEALRGAGIVPVFAAGNAGPNSATSMSPANNPAALSVGAVDNGDGILLASTRGPTDCGGFTRSFPDLTAPGAAIRTADLFGGYRAVSGTSLAAPHVAGALALLLGALPLTPPGEVEAALEDTAADLGPAGIDDTFGHGRIDVLAAYERLAPPDPILYFSVHRPFAVGASVFWDEDVESFDGQSVKLLFDGSDVGVGAGVDALAVVDAETMLLSFDRPVSLWPAGTVDDSDLVRFRADSLGESTGGSFELAFDGSDVGLTTEGEDVDAVELLSGGGLLLSTRRRARVPGARGGGADLFLFVPSELGARTRGSWRVLSRGHTLGLRGPAERVDSLAAAPGTLLLGTAGPFSVPGMSGTSSDVLALAGFRRPGPPSFFLRGAALGVGSANVDAIDLPP